MAAFKILTGVAASASVANAAYSVTVQSYPSTPVVSYLNGNTAWPQSFNPSWVEASAGTSGVSGLLIRSQNCSGFKPGHCISCNVGPSYPIAPYFPGSVITFAAANGDGSFKEPYLVFAPDNVNAPQNESFGTEDPRLAYDAATGLYHLFYTCYGPPGPYLCQATTSNPTAPYPGNWTRLGVVLPSERAGSKSGALLIRPSPPHYLYWGAGTIALASTTDFVTFTNLNSSFIHTRPGYFDNNLVEAGPPPLQLSTGDYIFFHNSANSSSGGGDFDAYNPGWVILDGNDPTTILQRSPVPLLTPVYGWEQGVAPYECNVHNVTFLEAAAPVPGQPNTFDVYFGGSDAVVGTARIVVTAA